jgi:RNA polymerase sigma-B factor
MTSTEIPVGPDAARLARRWLRGVVPPLSASGAEAALLLSELVTQSVLNAPDDGDGAIQVNARRSVSSLRVEVSPSEEPSDDPASHLAFKVLDALAREWGHSTDDDVVVAWFEIRLPGGSTALAEAADEELLARAARDADSRDEIFKRHLSLATGIAGRFTGKGVDAEDLEQVASIGLVKAISRFDPESGVFQAFARATISGELKRHLRDTGWTMRVPRSVQESALEVTAAHGRLAQALGRDPGASDLAAETGRPLEEVVEALHAWSAYRPLSLDAPVGDEETATLLDSVGEDDPEITLSEEWQPLEEVIADLPERTREILYLRFFQDMTQAEIAERVGVSQMHVSRLLKAALETIREGSDGS